MLRVRACALAGGCLCFKKHLDILLHLSPITSCLPLHLSPSALTLHPSLSLSLLFLPLHPPPPTPNTLFPSLFPSELLLLIYSEAGCQRAAGAAIVRFCERVLLFMPLPAINHVFLPPNPPNPLWEDGVGGEMTVDGPMIHRNEEEEEEGKAGRDLATSRSPPLALPASVASLRLPSLCICPPFPFMPSHTRSRCHTHASAF